MYGEYLPINAELGHGVDDAQECGDSLCLLSDLGLVDLELETVVLEILFDLLAVDIIDVQVCHCKHSSPALITFGQLTVLRVEDPIEEGEVVRDSLVAIHVEAILGFGDRSYKIRHFEYIGRMLN